MTIEAGLPWLFALLLASVRSAAWLLVSPPFATRTIPSTVKVVLAISLALPVTGPLGELSRLVALLAGSGDASPAGLMFLGLGLIGLRDRIERGFRGDA